MPIFSYICNECGEKFDLLVGVVSKGAELKCKKCSSRNIQKTLSSFSVGNSDGKVSSSGPSCPTGTCPTGL